METKKRLLTYAGLKALEDELERKANQYIVSRYSDKKYILKETIKRYT